jgi:hypothetical protein
MGYWLNEAYIGADSVTISPDIGAVSASGSAVLMPAATATSGK